MEETITYRARALFVGACLSLIAAGTNQALAQSPTPAIAAAVADPSRPAADSQRDLNRHPAEVLAFAGVKPGQKIVEFAPGGGYFTRLLIDVIGPRGHLFAVVPSAAAARGTKAADALAVDHPNISVLVQTGSTFTLPDKVDVAWTTDNYHDLRNPGYGGQDMALFDKAVFDALKPGGIFLIEDYHTAPGAGASQTNTLHRIEESLVKSEVVAAGFVFDGESTVLSNPKDDHSLRVFDPAIRGEADQYVLRFRKPK